MWRSSSSGSPARSHASVDVEPDLLPERHPVDGEQRHRAVVLGAGDLLVGGPEDPQDRGRAPPTSALRSAGPARPSGSLRWCRLDGDGDGDPLPGGRLGQRHRAEQRLALGLLGRPGGVESRGGEPHGSGAGPALQVPQQCGAIAVPAHRVGELAVAGGRGRGPPSPARTRCPARGGSGARPFSGSGASTASTRGGRRAARPRPRAHGRRGARPRSRWATPCAASAAAARRRWAPPAGAGAVDALAIAAPARRTSSAPRAWPTAARMPAAPAGGDGPQPELGGRARSAERLHERGHQRHGLVGELLVAGERPVGGERQQRLARCGGHGQPGGIAEQGGGRLRREPEPRRARPPPRAREAAGAGGRRCCPAPPASRRSGHAMRAPRPACVRQPEATWSAVGSASASTGAAVSGSTTRKVARVGEREDDRRLGPAVGALVASTAAAGWAAPPSTDVRRRRRSASARRRGPGRGPPPGPASRRRAPPCRRRSPLDAAGPRARRPARRAPTANGTLLSFSSSTTTTAAPDGVAGGVGAVHGVAARHPQPGLDHRGVAAAGAGGRTASSAGTCQRSSAPTHHSTDPVGAVEVDAARPGRRRPAGRRRGCR